jgi:hypothetical protein
MRSSRTTPVRAIPGAAFATCILAALTSACGEAPDSAEGATTDAVPIATVRQFGPVGYRDPIGVISPDGRWLATAAQQVLQVRTLPDGEARDLEAGIGRINILRWTDDGALAIAQAGESVTWWRYDVASGARAPLWAAGTSVRDTTSSRTVIADRFADVAWSRDGRLLALEAAGDSTYAWTIGPRSAAGTSRSFAGRLSFPAWLPDGRVACLTLRDGAQRITLPCGEGVLAGTEAMDAFGPIAASPDGALLYAGIANEKGFLDLWEWRVADGTGHIISSMGRDTYAPSVADDGTLLFRRQE